MINKVYGLLGISAKAGKVISGTEIVTENINKRKVKLVIVATDSSDRTKNNIKQLCDKNNIKIVEFGTIIENSKSIGKENKAIIGIIDENLSISILNKISGGESYGEN